jgi:hypothetical protein
MGEDIYGLKIVLIDISELPSGTNGQPLSTTFPVERNGG